MKNTKTCPKCGGRNIAPVPGADGFIPRADASVLPVERYVCLNCGYLESWMDLDVFNRMGSRECWEKLRQAEEADRKFGAELAYYSEKARQEREQPAKQPQAKQKKRRDDPWT